MARTNGKKVLEMSGCEAVYVSCEYMIRYQWGEGGPKMVDE